MNKFKALYVINKSAKKYKNLPHDKDKTRSQALYELKHRLINHWHSEFSTIEKHYIKGREHLYFKKENYSFHIPIDKFRHNVEIEESKELTQFQPEPVNETNLSEREALEYILNNTGYNPNDFLPRNSDPNAKWGYLF